MKAAGALTSEPRGPRAILQIPLWLFWIGLFGLIGALVVDGPLDLLGVLAAASGLPVIGWAIVRGSRRRGP